MGPKRCRAEATAQLSAPWSLDARGSAAGTRRRWEESPACADKPSWCHGAICHVPPPQERLPAVPVRPEQHNIAASAMPCRAAHAPPPPCSLSVQGRTARAVPHGPHGSDDAAVLVLCSGTHPMPSVLPKEINSAWAHAQCLQFCQKKYIPHGHTPNAVSSAAGAHAQCLQFCQK